MKKLILVKLGGSLITNKSKPFSHRPEVISNLVSQIKKAWEEDGYQIIVGHGGGSYPHVPALKYRTMEGMIDSESLYGATVVEDAAAQLNRLVVSEFLKQKMPAVSINPSSLLLLDSKKAKESCLEPLKQMLKIGVVPVIYGDVIFDTKQGFTIWSTEQLLNFLAESFMNSGVGIDKIIHCGETDGFMIDGKVIAEISSENFPLMKQNISKTEGFDVTGGMLHKIEEALRTANAGIDSYIIGGNHGGNLYRAIAGKEFIGTKIRI
jgi:isopentenyl phosphate kinase